MLWVQRWRHRAVSSKQDLNVTIFGWASRSTESLSSKPELNAIPSRLEMGDCQTGHEVPAYVMKPKLDAVGGVDGRPRPRSRRDAQELRGQESKHDLDAQCKDL